MNDELRAVTWPKNEGSLVQREEENDLQSGEKSRHHQLIHQNGKLES